MKIYLAGGTALLTTIGLAAAAGAQVSASPVEAQSVDAAAAQPAANASGGDILVTARRRQETLQSIPAAVEAITQENLTRAGATSLADVARLTPGLTFYQGNGGGLAAPTIRGVSTTSTTTFDNNVGVFIDGVYLSAKSNLDLDLFTLDRIEVIKGPQSALYGNNAFSGAVNYVLAKPSDHFTGHIRATGGTDGRADVAVLLSGPLTNTLSALVTGSYSHFNGTVENILGSNLGGWKYKVSASGSLRWQPTTAIDASLFYYHYEDKEDGSAGYIFANNCGGLNSNPLLTARGRTNLRYACGTLQAPDAVAVDPASYSKRRSDIGIGKFAYKFGKVTARLTGSYGSYNTFALQDQSLSAVPAATPTAARTFTQPFVGPVKEYSGELRLESYNNKFFDWAAGGYYYHRKADQYSIAGVGPTQTAKTLYNVNTDRTVNKSVFGIGTFHLTHAFDVELQGRWTWEDKSASLANLLTGLVRTPAQDYSYGTYRATANYTWSNGKLLYAVVGRGTKSGGFNNTAVVSEQSFGPEKNTTYEIGSKNRFANGLVTINVAAFYIDWTALQLSVPSAVTGQTNPVRNVGSAKVKGAEIEMAIRPTPHWTLNVAYTYSLPTWNKGTVDFSSTRQCATAAACGLTAAGAGFDISGFQLPRSSEHQGVFSSTYSIPLGGSEIYVRGDVSYQSAQFTNAPIDLQNNGDQTLVNARLGWIKGKLELSVFTTNLFNKRYITNAINEPEFVPVTTFSTGFVGNGRTVGATADFRF